MAFQYLRLSLESTIQVPQQSAPQRSIRPFQYKPYAVLKSWQEKQGDYYNPLDLYTSSFLIVYPSRLQVNPKPISTFMNGNSRSQVRLPIRFQREPFHLQMVCGKFITRDSQPTQHEIPFSKFLSDSDEQRYLHKHETPPIYITSILAYTKHHRLLRKEQRCR